MAKYIDIDSSFRDRSMDQLPSKFTLNMGRSDGCGWFSPLSNQIITFPPQTPIGSTNLEIGQVAFGENAETGRKYLPYMFSVQESDTMIMLDELPLAPMSPNEIALSSADLPTNAIQPASHNNAYIDQYIENVETGETRKIVGYTFSDVPTVLQTITLVAYTVSDGNVIVEAERATGNTFPPSTVDRFYQGKYLRFSDGSGDKLITNYSIVNGEIPIFTLESGLDNIPKIPQTISIVSSGMWIANIESPFSTPIPRYPAYSDINFSSAIYSKIPISNEDKIFCMDMIRHSDNTIGLAVQTYQQVLYFHSLDISGKIWSESIVVDNGPYSEAAKHGISLSIVDGFPAVLFSSGLSTIANCSYSRAQDPRGEVWGNVYEVSAEFPKKLPVSWDMTVEYTSPDMTDMRACTLEAIVSSGGSVRGVVKRSVGGPWETRNSNNSSNWVDMTMYNAFSFAVANNSGINIGAYDSSVGDWVYNTSGYAWTCLAVKPTPSGPSFVVMLSADGMSGFILDAGDSASTVETHPCPVGNWTSMCYSQELDLFVAVASSGDNQLMTSSDMINWTVITTPQPNQQFTSICWSPVVRKFVATSIGTNADGLYSDDGIIWKLGNGFPMTDILWAEDFNIFIATDGTGSSGWIFISYDGINWVFQPIPHSIKRLYWHAPKQWLPEPRLYAISSDGNTCYKLVPNFNENSPLTLNPSNNLLKMQVQPATAPNPGFPEFVVGSSTDYYIDNQAYVMRASGDFNNPTWRAIPLLISYSYSRWKEVPLIGVGADISTSFLSSTSNYNNPVIPDNMLSRTTVLTKMSDEDGAGIFYNTTGDMFEYDGTFSQTPSKGFYSFSKIPTTIPQIIAGDLERTVDLLAIGWRTLDDSINIIRQKPVSAQNGSNRRGFWAGYPGIVPADNIHENNLLLTSMTLTTEYLSGDSVITSTYIDNDGNIRNVSSNPDRASSETNYIVDSAELDTVNLTVYSSLIQHQTSADDRFPLIAFQSMDRQVYILTPNINQFQQGVQYKIRQNLPESSGTVVSILNQTEIEIQPTSTIPEPGSYIWIYSVPPVSDPDFIIDNYRRIIDYDPITNIITVNPALSIDISSSPDSYQYEILKFTKDSYSPLVYIGTQVQSLTCYEISLISLILPNIVLSVGSGSRIANYPYVYVEFSNYNSAPNNVLYSNNPNSNRVLFKVPTPNIVDPDRAVFVSMSGGGMTQTIHFKPNDNFRFAVYLPNGQLFETLITDTQPPFPPNPNLQISATFAIKRL